jgi:putative transcriptional regulator
MANKVTRRKIGSATGKVTSLADDIRASLHEARDLAAGKRTKAVGHVVTPHATDAREARLKLGLSQREFADFIGTAVGTVRKWELGTRHPSGAARTLIEVIKTEPKAVRRALLKTSSAA